MVYSDSLTAVSDDAFKYSGDKRYPTAAANMMASIAAISSTPCDVLIPAHPDLSNVWEVFDEQGKGDRTKFIDSAACKRYAAAAKTRFERRLEQERK